MDLCWPPHHRCRGSNCGDIHSMGGKNGKLESMRPLLGYIMHTYEVDKIWERQRDAVVQRQMEAYNRNLAAGYAQIEAAGPAEPLHQRQQ